MKILITTIVALNPGDAAILLGTVRLLRRTVGDSVTITAVDGQAEAAGRLYPWMRFMPALFGMRSRSLVGRWIARLGYEHRLRRLDATRLTVAGLLMNRRLKWLASIFASSKERATISEYLSADLVLASGGTYLVPAYDMESPLRDYEFTLRLGKRLGFMPQSMGPFKGSRLQRRFAKVFSRSTFVMVRENTSRGHLLEISVPDQKVTVFPDAAFALGNDIKRRTSPDKDSRPLRIAVSVRDWKHFKNTSGEDGLGQYLLAVAGLVSWLVTEKSAVVTFISSCQGIPEYWTDDSSIAHEIHDLLAEDVAASVIVDEQFRDPQALLVELTSFDLVVATRMHVAILSLCAGVPVLPIAYEFKTTELFESLGLGEFLSQIESVDAQGLVAKMSLALDQRISIGSRLGSEVTKLREQLSGIDEMIASVFESPDSKTIDGE